jgi:CRP-like cAMP-binding protein
MSDRSLVDVLRKIGFLDGIGDEHLERIASVAEMVQFEDGKLIFREGEPADDVYLLISGSVSLEVCAPALGCRRILTVGPGEMLGWSPVLGQPRLTATARTLSPTQAVRVNANQILTLCQHDPGFGYEFTRRVALALAKRLRAARLQLLDVYGVETPPAEQSSAD